MPTGKIRKPKKRCCRAWFDYATGITHINKRCDARAQKGVPYAPVQRAQTERQLAYLAFVQQAMAGAPRGPGSGPARQAMMKQIGAAWTAKHGKSTKARKNVGPRAFYNAFTG